MRKPPKPYVISKHAAPETHCIAWSVEAKSSALTGHVKVEEKERARRELEAEIRRAGYDPQDCAFTWTLIDTGWGWTARVRESAA